MEVVGLGGDFGVVAAEELPSGAVFASSGGAPCVHVCSEVGTGGGVATVGAGGAVVDGRDGGAQVVGVGDSRSGGLVCRHGTLRPKSGVWRRSTTTTRLMSMSRSDAHGRGKA